MKQTPKYVNMKHISTVERSVMYKFKNFDIHTMKNDIERYDTIILLLNLYFAFRDQLL